MYSAIETAKHEGEAKGKIEEKIEIALKAIEMGMSIEDIRKLTDLSEEQIKAIFAIETILTNPCYGSLSRSQE